MFLLLKFRQKLSFNLFQRIYMQHCINYKLTIRNYALEIKTFCFCRLILLFNRNRIINVLLTGQLLWQLNVILMLYNIEHRTMSIYRTVLVLISSLDLSENVYNPNATYQKYNLQICLVCLLLSFEYRLPHKQLLMALQGKPLKDRPPLTMQPNNWRHFVNSVQG